MKYILKYKDKEDFLEDNPKEENKLPVVWCYPEERMREAFYRNDPDSELELGRYVSVLNYNESGVTDIVSLGKPTVVGKETYNTFFVSNLNENTECYVIKSGMTIEPGQWGVDETAQGGIPLGRNVLFFNVNAITGHTPEVILNENTSSDYAFRMYGCSAFTSDSWYLAHTKEETAYTADSKDIAVEEDLHHWPLFSKDYDNYFGFKMPSGTPASSYTVFAKVIYDRINGEEAHLPGVLFEPVNDGFRVKQFLLLPGVDLSSCGYTATANQWFGLYIPTEEPEPGPKDKSGESKVIIPPEQPGEDEQEGNVSPFVFGEFYTEGETGVVTSGNTSMYFTIFYRTDESSVIPSTGKGKTLKTPYFALTKVVGGENFVYEWEGYYDIYSAITRDSNTLLGESYYEGSAEDIDIPEINIAGRLSGLCGSITMIGTGSDNKDYVTKVEPGFAYVKDPMSVYYNKSKKTQSNDTSNQTNDDTPFVDPLNPTPIEPFR